MGTTVTTNLGLIKPDTAESIREDLPTFDGWVSQNADNMDVIDGLFRQTVVSSYTVNWQASATNPTLGTSGFTEGKYIRLFPRMVIVYFRIYMGTTGFTDGDGHYSINAPLAFDPDFSDFSHSVSIGKAIFRNNNAVSTSSVFAVTYQSADERVYFRPSAGGAWDAVTPVIPEQEDRISGYFMYPTAVV